MRKEVERKHGIGKGRKRSGGNENAKGREQEQEWGCEGGEGSGGRQKNAN